MSKEFKNISGQCEFFKERTLCKICERIPFMTVSSLAPFTIKMRCDLCRREWFEEFRNLVKECDLKKNRKEIGYCIAHLDKENISYCKTCGRHFCDNCVTNVEVHAENHKSSIVQLSTLPKIEEFTSKILAAKSHVLAVSNTDWSAFNFSETEYAQINQAVEKYFCINSSIIEFSEILVNNSNQNDYASMINLIENTKFKLSKIEKGLSCKEIIAHLEIILDIDNKNLKYLRPEYEVQLEKEFKEHSKSVMALCLLKDGRIASCSLDNSINIINLATGKCEIKITEVFGVFSLSAMRNGNLISCTGSGLNLIHIWKIEGNEYKNVAVLDGHKKVVIKVEEVDDKYIVSSSLDMKIIVWSNKAPYNKIKILSGHTGIVRTFIKLKESDTLVSGSYNITAEEGVGDGTIRFWSFTVSSGPDTTIVGPDCCGDSMTEIKDNFILSGGCDLNIYMIDCILKKVERIFDTSLNDWSLTNFNDYILIGDEIGRILIFDVKNDYPVAIENAHEKGIVHMVYNKGMIFTCSEDCKIKVWKLNKVK